MTREIDVYGVYLPHVLLLAVLALALTGLLRRVLGAMGCYQWVWHRSLFNFSLFVIVLSGMVEWTGFWKA